MKREFLGIIGIVAIACLEGGCAPRGYNRVFLASQTVECYILGRGGVQMLNVGIKEYDGQWYVGGQIRGSPPLTRSRATLRVEAVASDESLVSASSGHAKRRPGKRLRKARFAWFRVKIPCPDDFDHLHLALVSPTDLEKPLPPHGAGK